MSSFPTCPTPSTTSITCIYGTSVSNVQPGGSCKCKCATSQGSTNGVGHFFNSPTSAACTPSACLTGVGLSVCPSNSGYTYTAFTAEYLTNSQLNNGGDYAQWNDYGGSIYGTSVQLGVGSICYVTQFTCSATLVAQQYCQTSQINELITQYGHWNASSTIGSSTTRVGATAACTQTATLSTPYISSYSGAYLCNTNNCNTLTAVKATTSSATLVKSAAGIIAATTAAMFI